MSKHRPKTRRHNRIVRSPSPRVEEIEAQLKELLSPGLMSWRIGEWIKGGRQRVLTLPVIATVMLGVVLRQAMGFAEFLRLMAQERVLWLEDTLGVSESALSKRLQKIPALFFERMLTEVCQRLHEVLLGMMPSEWLPLVGRFSKVYIMDGTTLEEISKRLKGQRGQSNRLLGGKFLMLINFWTRLPVKWVWTEKARANDKSMLYDVEGWLERGMLIVMDMGFFSFKLMDELTEKGVWFVMRLRAGTSYEVVKAIESGEYVREYIIKMGLYRSNPCKNLVRLVEFRYGGQWYSYITNVLEHESLRAEEVVWIYWRRWRIEDMFLSVKQVLGAWTLLGSHENVVQIQWMATLIIYAVIERNCWEVSRGLNIPPEQVSREMVFRALYHYGTAVVQNGYSESFTRFLVERKEILGIVKKVRKKKPALYLLMNPDAYVGSLARA